ncbi:hypothetical protein [Natronobacterium gregoryi]|uniref:Uncharacterized protein n=2 Tax=Natronobacterium gregoryi TaxID=44930 RepID=L0AG74_NATGS|nr:hypothetical protein [Natronobacterium gregoryi]AFZ72928.1 hypothetical protein Natgr_1731 [Natronobacterium gregoryi SP2]PLK21845.1 hypothetical protein CYV19_01745 [Natronobacterium gregoryi SP2]SFI67616.1 hypothetical protein SAMN05443661_10396 [Natronobacterium gregoryi]
MSGPKRSSAARLRSVLVGTAPARAGLVVAAVGIGIVACYVAIDLFGLPSTHPPGTTVLLVGFWVIPALAGIVCGWHRLGFLAALGSGITPILVLYALQLLVQPDGDLPAFVFALMLGGQSVPFAVGGFVLGATAALLLE